MPQRIARAQKMQYNERMVLSAVLSKPAKTLPQKLDKPYVKVCFVYASNGVYKAEFFTKTQVFHKVYTCAEFEAFIKEFAGLHFKHCVQRTENTEIVLLANKKGKITQIERPLIHGTICNVEKANDRKKNYFIAEGMHVPFLIALGVMTSNGKIVKSKYDKFRQVNRFLEFIDDVLPSLQNRPLRIVDFGCGKSYLTFAVQYFLSELQHIDAEIIGLDLKESVVNDCNRLARQLCCTNLHFQTGDIANYRSEVPPDMVISLHACDTATDYALSYAVQSGAKVILSVPCCQHELNVQLSKYKNSGIAFAPFMRYGLLQERFAALATDALRAEILEQSGYSTQVLEFIDMEHTAKNILLRAVRRVQPDLQAKVSAKARADALLQALGARPLLADLQSVHQ